MCVVMCVAADMVADPTGLQNADAVALPSMLKPYLYIVSTVLPPTLRLAYQYDRRRSQQPHRQTANKVPAVYTLPSL